MMLERTNDDYSIERFQELMAATSVARNDSDLPARSSSKLILPGGTVPNNSDHVSNVKSETDKEKKMRRVMANRQSAKHSRERRKHLLDKLGKEVAVLSDQNRSISQVNAELQSQVQVLRQQLVLALEVARREQEPEFRHYEQPLPNVFDLTSDNPMQLLEPHHCTSIVKGGMLEPINIEEDSLWDTPDVWEPNLESVIL